MPKTPGKARARPPMIVGAVSWHTQIVTYARAFAALCVLAPLAACVTPDEEPELAAEVPGQPLDRAGFCPDVTVDAPQRVNQAELRQLGACGDALVDLDTHWRLLPIDGPAIDLPAAAAGEGFVFHQLSPRGRILASHDYSSGEVGLQVLGSDEPARRFALTEPDPGARSREGFVISKHGLGAQFWTCADGDLILRDPVDEADDERLAGEVDCDTVTASSLHSTLAFATLADEVAWVDTDALTLTPVTVEDFVRGDSQVLGTRRDNLRMATSGPYLVQTQAVMMDNDGFPDEIAYAEVLYDVEADARLIDSGEQDWLTRSQAAVFGAPMFVVSDDALYGARDGELISIVTGIEPFGPAANPDGSVVFIEPVSRAVVRYSGDRFETREVELGAQADQAALRLSPDGRAGTVMRTLDECVDPNCDQTFRVLRQFGPAGEGFESRWAGHPFVAHVFDSGAMVVVGTLEGGAPGLVLLSPEGQPLTTEALDERLSPRSPVVLADGRLLIGMGHFQVADVLLAVDPVEGTIGSAGVDVASVYDIERVEVDALGKRIAVALSGTGGTIWGEL